MLMPRKTVRVVDLVTSANDMLRKSTGSAESRMSVCIFLENILHENGVYAGYNYLTADEIPAGHNPGILVESDGHREFDRALCDETRRYYHIDRRIAD